MSKISIKFKFNNQNRRIPLASSFQTTLKYEDLKKRASDLFQPNLDDKEFFFSW